jgi:hypothetical protein
MKKLIFNQNTTVEGVYYGEGQAVAFEDALANELINTQIAYLAGNIGCWTDHNTNSAGVEFVLDESQDNTIIVDSEQVIRDAIIENVEDNAFMEEQKPEGLSITSWIKKLFS